MSLLALLAGAVIIAVVFVDFLHSTITTRGAGPLTTALTAGMWRLIRNGPRRLVRYAGPMTLLGAACLWIVGPWLGWSLVFVAGGDILRAPDGSMGSTLIDKAAFVVSLLSTLGLGVFTPTAAPWHLAAGLAAVNGMVVLTLSISYVLSVLQTAIEARGLAAQVSVLGDTPEAILRRGFDGEGFTALADYLGGMGPDLAASAQRFKAYPLAACFDRGGGDLHVSEVAARLRVVLDVLPASTRRRLNLVLLDEALSELVREASLATDLPRPAAVDRAALRAEGMPV